MMDIWQAAMWFGLIMLGVLGVGSVTKYVGYCWRRGVLAAEADAADSLLEKR